MHTKLLYRTIFALVLGAALLIGASVSAQAALRAKTVFSDGFSYGSSASLHRRWEETGSSFDVTHWKPSHGTVMHMPSGDEEQTELWSKKTIDLRSAQKVKIQLRALWKLDSKADDTFIVFISRQESTGWSDYDVYHVSGSSRGKWKNISFMAPDAAGYKVRICVAVSTGDTDPFWVKGRGAKVDKISVVSYR